MKSQAEKWHQAGKLVEERVGSKVLSRERERGPSPVEGTASYTPTVHKSNGITKASATQGTGNFVAPAPPYKARR